MVWYDTYTLHKNNYTTASSSGWSIDSCASGTSISNNYIKLEIEHNFDPYSKCKNYKNSTTTNNCSLDSCNSWYSTSASTGIRIKYDLWSYHDCALPKLIFDPKERLRDIIQSRQAPVILTSRKPILTPKDVREIRARETLCRVLGEDKFQKFLKDGFVSVRAKSGMVYQIFPGNDITNVYKDGDHVERLCVVLKGQFPPTDSLIMRYLIILNDENRFRGYAIKHQIIMKKPKIAADGRSLTEIFKELKNVA